MSRTYNKITIQILQHFAASGRAVLDEVKQACAPKMPAKDFYNYLFRLQQQDLIKRYGAQAEITEQGRVLISRLAPGRDGVWKLVIFDIPEKHKYVRTVLRAKLKQLHFKKWQNSIWISPYKMDQEIEQELNELGKKFFVRLIKTTDINHLDDLRKLFPD